MGSPVAVNEVRKLEGELIFDLTIKSTALREFTDQARIALADSEQVKYTDEESLERALEGRIGQENLETAIAEAAMNMAAPFGRSLIPDVLTVGQPHCASTESILDQLKKGNDYSFVASWASLPRADIDSYDPVEFTVPIQKVPTELVDDQISKLLEKAASFERTDSMSPIEQGEAVDLSLETTLHGTRVEGLCFTSRPYVTGSGSMPASFEQNIVGMSVGQTTEFEFTGIASIDEDGHPVEDVYSARACVLSKLRKKTPVLTDEWVANTFAGCSSIEDLRNRISSELMSQVSEERRHYLNYRAASELAKRYTGHIPDQAYEAVREQLQSELESNANESHMSIKEFLESQGMNEQQFGVRTILEAHERLAQIIALDAYARHMGITVDELDLQEFYHVQAPGHEGEYRKQVESSGHAYLAEEGALRLKTSEYLVRHARINEVDMDSSKE
ncbi:MAG: hypothetical protein SOI38_03210 [Eggerthellaceae bacterium]|jgi:trigger factor